MHLEFLVSLPHVFATIARDNSTAAFLVLILGVVGGCMLSAWRERSRSRQAQFTRLAQRLDPPA